MEFIEFMNYKTNTDMKDFFKDKDKLNQMISKESFNYIFFDEAEDLGINELTRIIEAVLENQRGKQSEYFQVKNTLGHFWILFDVFQSEIDTHGINIIGKKR